MTVDSTGTPFNAVIEGEQLSKRRLRACFRPQGRVRLGDVFDRHERKEYRYYLVWLRLPSHEGQAAISEVRAKT